MRARPNSLRALIFHREDAPLAASEIFRLRKRLFVDQLGWLLPASSEEERDEFDTTSAAYCGLYLAGQLVGTFRAIRCDQPYLSCIVFSRLATTRGYPRRQDCWEISRFGVLPEHSKFGPTLYAVMLQFGWVRQARSLVATANLSHERLLRKLGVRTRRYGPPQCVGQDVQSQPVEAVAGEIPLDEQSEALRRSVTSLLSAVDISDETLVLRPERLSA